MTLSAGTRLGPYEIEAAIGAGGMGEVYRARDTRLNREVAIKILSAAFAHDADRLRRFEQEARAVAALNHPNILAIHDIGAHTDGAPYLVSELLEGQSVRERLRDGPLPVRKAVECAVQVAHGLAAAHEKGIVHRDLKPENLFLTRDGRLKILDFGLAKLAPAQPESAIETVSPPAAGTQTGVVLGTAGYMSPEQVRGKTADHRSDIFSVGAILYELLTGRRAFQGDSPVETMHAILKSEPPEMSASGAGPALDRIVQRCLEKPLEQRFQSASDLAFALETASGSTTAPGPSLPETGRAAPLVRGPWALAALLVAGLVLVAGLAAGAWLQARRAGAQPRWSATRLGGSEIAMGPRISPDGRTLAFQAFVDGLTQVAVMNPASGNWTVLTSDRSRGWVSTISWAPDGARIYYGRHFVVPRGVYSIPALGGEERLVLEDAAFPEVLPDGSILISRINPQRQNQLHRFWPASGRLDPLPAVGGGVVSIRAFPDGKEAVYYGRPLPAGSAGATNYHYLLDLATGQSRRLAPSLVERFASDFHPLSVDPANKSVITNVKNGDLTRIVALPRDGSGIERTLIALTLEPFYMDLAPDGSLYVDQPDRPLDALRFSLQGGNPERLAGSLFSATELCIMGLPLPDGRTLLPSIVSGRSRLLVARPEKNPVPLVDTEEETAPPLALLGGREVALLAGSGPERVVAIVSTGDGRIVRRLNGTKGSNIAGMSGSPDGKTIYYAASGHIWAIPATDGQPRKIRAGDGVAAHPNGQELIVQLIEKEGVRLVRVPLSGGAEKNIPIHGPFGLAPVAPASNAIRADGRVVLTLASPDSWFWGAGVLDLNTGKIEKVPLNYPGDIFSPGWAHDGRIVTMALHMQSSLWRFGPEGAEPRR